ncbi:M48 family metallopeptidase [Glaciecola sp. 1036]|uniref:M48 family metallopeptidase n=1 Tax=Alteromonadaceae TaxID=72275 RepID=UPI003D08A913
MFEIEAKFYPSGSSSCQQIQLKCYDSGMFSFDSETVESKDYYIADHNISDKLGNLPREIAIKEVGLLVVESTTEFDTWLAQHKSERLHKFESNKKMIVASFFAVPITLYLLFKFAVPYAAVAFADIVPYGAVKIASKQTLDTLEATILDPTELPSEFVDETTEYWDELLYQLDTEHLHFHIQFRNSETMGANAFALPDGTIVFTDQLVELFEQDRDLLTSVLLHEVGHVEEKHSMRLIAETLVSSLVISYFFGDVSGVLEVLGGVTTTVTNNQFTQDLEWEADNFALEQLPTLGLEPKLFADAMEKFAEEYGKGGGKLEEFLSSHPLVRQRIENALNAEEIKESAVQSQD